jgi:hypothetical protein
MNVESRQANRPHDEVSPVHIAGMYETEMQHVVEQMYQIIRTKIPVEGPFFWGHEPILRDTLTEQVQLIVNGSRTGEL